MRCRKTALQITCVVLTALTPASLRGSSLFQSVQTYRSAGTGTAGSRAIAVADVNRDGKPDVLVANVCSVTNCDGTVGVLLGNGDGTFQPAKATDSGLTFASSIAVADINGDGKPDLVVSTSAGCSSESCVNLSVLFGNGDGTFGAPHLYASGALQVNSIRLADVNRDGKLDLLVANQCFSNSNCEGALGVLLGNGDGSFQAAQTYDSGSRRLFSLAVGDFNRDGKLDVAVVHEEGVIGVLLGNGNGTFQPVQTYDSGGTLSYSIAVADVNGDGKADLLVTNQCNSTTCVAGTVGVLLGNGNGTFQAAQTFSTHLPGAQSVVVADVNGDGKLDLLVANTCNGCSSSPVAVLLGNGDGTFPTVVSYYSGSRNSYSIVAADVNGDSKPDLLVANGCFSSTDCTTGGVGVLLGTAGVHTTTKLRSSLNPSIYGQAVHLTAVVSSVGSSTPAGTVTFRNGWSAIGTVTLSGGIAVLTTTSLPAGIRSLTAVYSGDLESGKSTSAPLSQTVNKASSTTTITSSLNPSTQGQPVTFTAKVTSPTSTVTGAVRFSANGATLDTVTLSGGKASLTTSALPKGSNEKIIGTYIGTANITGSAASVLQNVN